MIYGIRKNIILREIGRGTIPHELIQIDIARSLLVFKELFNLRQLLTYPAHVFDQGEFEIIKHEAELGCT